MKETFVKETMRVELQRPILIEGFPGLGMVGKIATKYLIKKLEAKKYAELFSPHFPYYVLVNRKGSVRLLRGTFHYWKNGGEKGDLLFLTGNDQAQTIEGQYEVAACVLDFAEKCGVKTVATIGGYRKEAGEKPKVIATATSQKLLSEAKEAGAIASSAGNPIVGIAGLLLGLTRFRRMDAVCLLGETRGYLPDPWAAKAILNVLCKMFHVPVDLGGLDEEIEKSKKALEKMRQIEKKRKVYTQKARRVEEERTSYIS